LESVKKQRAECQIEREGEESERDRGACSTNSGREEGGAPGRTRERSVCVRERGVSESEKSATETSV